MLLESSKECTTARPPKKASLMERGEFILPAGICRKHLKLGAFSKSKKGTSLFIALVVQQNGEIIVGFEVKACNLAHL